jgi:glucose/arabinose dehydrogenase
MNTKTVTTLALIFATACDTTPAADPVGSQQHRFRVEAVADNLNHPWSMAFLPGGDMLVTERPGRLRLIRDGRLLREPVAGIPPVTAGGQGGLLDVAVHPGFANNGLVYLSYAAAGDGGVGTEVARGVLAGDRLDQVEVIFRALPKRRGGRHFGSRLLFAADGSLFISLGDRGHRPNGQDQGTHPGSMIRLRDDGSVPGDNPFFGAAGARPEIYSYGHRNVQGMALRPGTNEIWTHEHGPQGGDELNLLLPGRNYGWAQITYGANYGTGTDIGTGTHQAGMEQPAWYWVPSIAPSGMAFYIGDRFPRWRGNILLGALKYQMLVRLEVSDGKVLHEERMLKEKFGRIRDVRVGPDGLVYLLTDESDGALLRLVPAD